MKINTREIRMCTHECSIDFDIISIVWYVKKKENTIKELCKNYIQEDHEYIEDGCWISSDFPLNRLRVLIIIIIII